MLILLIASSSLCFKVPSDETSLFKFLKILCVEGGGGGGGQRNQNFKNSKIEIQNFNFEIPNLKFCA